jgi:hypothetical protein
VVADLASIMVFLLRNSTQRTLQFDYAKMHMKEKKSLVHCAHQHNHTVNGGFS